MRRVSPTVKPNCALGRLAASPMFQMSRKPRLIVPSWAGVRLGSLARAPEGTPSGSRRVPLSIPRRSVSLPRYPGVAEVCVSVSNPSDPVTWSVKRDGNSRVAIWS